MNQRTDPGAGGDAVLRAAEAIGGARRLVALTGAGMSVDSGLRDFRSREGWWRNIDPRTVATVEALEGNYDLFHAFYCARIEALEGVRPHAGYDALHRWPNLQRVATQNVDGLHLAAGGVPVSELHGTLRRFRCHRCGAPAEKERFLAKERCACGGPLRPNVVLFGEALPEEPWNEALEAIASADVVLVIGTSLQVYPVNQLPRLSRGRLILLNKEETGMEHMFHTVLLSGARDGLLAIDRALRERGQA